MSIFLRGSLRIRVEGDCERLLDLCGENNIPLWDIEREDGFTVCLSVRVEHIYTLRRLCRKAMCRLHILKKKGLPFKARRAFRRPALLVGLALCLGALWVMSQFVWTIEINTEGKLKEREVRQLLSDAGLKAGVPVRSVRAQRIKNSVISAADNIAYLTVNIKGSHACVNVYERTVEKEISETVPCDVISGLTGVITAIRVKQGVTQLRIGQTVQAGDIIASGAVTDALGETRYYHADAEIDLRTWYTRKAAVPTELFEYVPTGETKTRSYLIVGQKTVKLYLIESIGYKWYYKSIDRKSLTIGEDIVLPVTLVTETYTECERRPIELDEEQFKELIEGRMLASFALAHPDASIVKSEFYINKNEKTCEGVLRLECAETTGIKTAR
ncbi:MAG: sporulation protein YqfD [Clostridia bacterium]|nr:sporulation protein YqfD [Clostridia bacterium]